MLTLQFLKRKPDPSARDVANEIGIALGRVSSLPSWKRVVAERKAKKKPTKKTEKRLSSEMLASIGKDVDPADDIMRREAVWRWLLEKADDKGRASGIAEWSRTDRAGAQGMDAR